MAMVIATCEIPILQRSRTAADRLRGRQLSLTSTALLARRVVSDVGARTCEPAVGCVCKTRGRWAARVRVVRDCGRDCVIELAVARPRGLHHCLQGESLF